jgi:ankyrin repeat protein
MIPKSAAEKPGDSAGPPSDSHRAPWALELDLPIHYVVSATPVILPWCVLFDLLVDSGAGMWGVIAALSCASPALAMAAIKLGVHDRSAVALYFERISSYASTALGWLATGIFFGLVSIPLVLLPESIGPRLPDTRGIVPIVIIALPFVWFTWPALALPWVVPFDTGEMVRTRTGARWSGPGLIAAIRLAWGRESRPSSITATVSIIVLLAAALVSGVYERSSLTIALDFIGLYLLAPIAVAVSVHGARRTWELNAARSHPIDAANRDPRVANDRENSADEPRAVPSRRKLPTSRSRAESEQELAQLTASAGGPEYLWISAAYATRDPSRRDALLALADPCHIETRDSEGRTALHLAAQEGNGPVIEALLEAGADLTAKDRSGSRPLHHLVTHALGPHYLADFLSRGASVSQENSFGATALHFAARSANPRGVRALLGAGADPQAINSNGRTALHELAESLRIRDDDPKAGSIVATILQDLLRSGTPIDWQDRYGREAMHVACERGAREVVRGLLDAGVDAMQPSKEGWTPLDYARHAPKIVELLVERGAKLDARSAIALGRVDVARAQLRERPSLASEPTSPYRPALLPLAIHHGEDELARELLALGASPEMRGHCSERPLQCAVCHRRDPRIVQTLLDAGASVDASDGDGFTALHRAAQNGDWEIAEILLDRGANPDLPTERNSTARQALEGSPLRSRLPALTS